MENAEQDIQARMLKEQQVEASRVIESVKAALFADSNLLDAAELNTIQNAITALAEISQTGNVAELEAALDILNNSTAIFAERRMDSSIRTALSGHSVDEV